VDKYVKPITIEEAKAKAEVLQAEQFEEWLRIQLELVSENNWLGKRLRELNIGYCSWCPYLDALVQVY
jgi:hypothetical protein